MSEQTASDVDADQGSGNLGRPLTAAIARRGWPRILRRLPHGPGRPTHMTCIKAVPVMNEPLEVGSAEDGWTGFRRCDADQAAALFDHGVPVVVPVWMLPGDGAVILDQRFHRLGQADDLDVTAELRPVAEEPVIEHAQPGSGVTLDIQGLYCGFACADDQTILRVDADEHR
jgi:hypothetical protein